MINLNAENIPEAVSKEAGRYFDFAGYVASGLGNRSLRENRKSRALLTTLSAYFDSQGERVLAGEQPEQLPNIQQDGIDAVVQRLEETCFQNSDLFDRARHDQRTGFDTAINQLEIALYDSRISANPKDAIAYHNRGYAKNSLGRHEEALPDFDKAIELDPKCKSAYNNRGYAKNSLGRHEEAITDLDKAIELDPKSAHSYSWRAGIFEKQNHSVKAESDYRTALRLLNEIPALELNKNNIRHLVKSTRGLRRIGPKNERVSLKQSLKARIREYRELKARRPF